MDIWMTFRKLTSSLCLSILLIQFSQSHAIESEILNKVIPDRFNFYPELKQGENGTLAKLIQAQNLAKENNMLLQEKSDSSLSSSTDSSDINLHIIKEASHFKDFYHHVDNRTGEFSISYKVADIIGNHLEDPSFSFSIIYSSLSKSNRFDLGNGWKWNLTYFDPKSKYLSLSRGGVYKLESNKAEKLKHYKLKDLIVSVSNKFIIIKYKDGREEVLDRRFGNLLRIVNAQGYKVEFSYIEGTKLSSISYDNNSGKNLDITKIVKLEIIYQSSNTIHIKRNDGSEKWPTTEIFKGNGVRISYIKNELKQQTHFSYKVPANENYVSFDLISEIKYPMGTEIEVKYLPSGLESRNKGEFFPAVERLTANAHPVSKSEDLQLKFLNAEIINYSYQDKSTRNYLGFGFSDYKKGSDILFSSANDYSYWTTEKKDTPNGVLTIERKYNHFNKIEEEISLLNGISFKKISYIYPEWKNKTIYSVEDNYNLPIEILTTFYNSKGKTRSESIKFTYDIYGNLLSTLKPNGLLTEYKYLPSEKTFNGINHLLERVVTSSLFDKKSKVTEYIYETSRNLIGKEFQRLIAVTYRASNKICHINERKCGSHYRSEIYSYQNVILSPFKFTENQLVYSLPVYNTVYSKFKNSCKIIRTHIKYESDLKFNTIIKKVENTSNSHAKDPLDEKLIYDAYTNKLVKKTDSQNMKADISYEYDYMGRVIKQTIGENFKKPITVDYDYQINYPIFGKSKIKVKKSDGSAYEYIYDSMGRLIEKYVQGNNENIIYFQKISSFSYNRLNQLESETSYNIDAHGSAYNVTKRFYYDSIGRKIKVIYPDNSKKIIDYDDVSESVTTYFISSNNKKSPLTTVTLNKFSKPISTTILSPEGEPYSQTQGIYDGFGNLVEAIDANGNTVKYEYDIYNNKVRDIYSNGNIICYEYDPLYYEFITQMSLLSKTEGKIILLGKKEYNIFGKLILDIDIAGNKELYYYDSSGNKDKQITRNGKEFIYTYDIFNRLIKKQVKGDNFYTVDYKYNNASNLLRSMKDKMGKTKYDYFKNGLLRRTRFFGGKKISYKYNFQGEIIEIDDVSNNKTIYHYSHANSKLLKAEFIRSVNNERYTEVYEYDDFSRMSKKVIPNGTYVIYQYDKMSNLNKITHFNAFRKFLFSYEFQYLKNLNISERILIDSNHKKSTEIYEYDYFNNLKKYHCFGDLCSKNQFGNTIVGEEYIFDSLNNLKTVKVDYGNSSSNTRTYYYNKNNPNLIEKFTNSNQQAGAAESGSFEYDLNENMIKDEQKNSYEYNPFNRLISITRNSKKTVFEYDGNNNLVFQINPFLQKIHFYYSGKTLLNEMIGTNIVSYFIGKDHFIGKFNNASRGIYYLMDQAHNVICMMSGGVLLENDSALSFYGIPSKYSNNRFYFSNKPCYKPKISIFFSPTEQKAS